MENRFSVVRKAVQQPLVLRIFDFLFKVIIIALIIIIVAYIGFAGYIHKNKKQVLGQVTQLLNNKISGTLHIGSMETTLLEDFPRASIKLKNVVLQDTLYKTHRKTLLTAGDAALTVNSLGLLSGDIIVKKITLKNANINIYTDEAGYSNIKSIFKKSSAEESGRGSFPELKNVGVENVAVTINNKQKNKLHEFNIVDGEAEVDETSSGWEADIEVNAFVKGLSFNTDKGSFIKEQPVNGDIEVVYNEGIAVIEPNKLRIGKEEFVVGGKFYTTTPKGNFLLSIHNPKTNWQRACRLLPENISKKLKKFSFAKPIAVKCEVRGSLNVPGEPFIIVNSVVKNNNVTTPGGKVTDCSFKAIYTNEYNKGKGYSDSNSVIEVVNVKGHYAEIPFTIKKGTMQNLKDPVVAGDISAEFNVRMLENLIDDNFISFKKGKANLKLSFIADIENFKLAKPQVQGLINVKGATVNYVPRNLNFNDVDVVLNFSKEDLHISRIKLKTGKSIVEMEGSIKNFLNLYYTAPEKVVLNWKIDSPQLYLQDFMGFAGSRKPKAGTKTKAKRGDITDELNTFFEKSSVSMQLKVDKLFFKKFYATGAGANILLTENALFIKNASLNHAGGYIRVDGQVLQRGSSSNAYAINAGVANVDINRFFTAFENFGMDALTADNLQGLLSSHAAIKGKINDRGALVPGTIKGNISFAVKEGRLIDFEPVKNIGKFAFPNRDVNNITFYDLNGKFKINGDKVTIHPMQINSSVLNMDVEGVYSFGKGTEIFVAVPIRNPKRDEGITDEKELEKRRNRGIVLHLVAEDDKNGKVKVKLGRKRKG